MRTLSADAKELKVRDLIEAARKEPVTIIEDGAPAAVVLSPAEFSRLDERDRIRREAKVRLRQTIAAIHKEAADRGLTDVELERLLADESESFSTPMSSSARLSHLMASRSSACRGSWTTRYC